MRLQKFVLSLLIATLVFALPTTAAKESKAPENPSKMESDGWTLDQTTQLVGEVQVTASAKGVKVVSRKKSLSMLCAAPFTEVVLFSERTKQYHVTPFDKFRCPVARTLQALNSGLLSDTPMIKKEDKVDKGMKVHVYVSTEQFQQSQMAKYRAREIPGRAVVHLVCYSTEDLKADPHIEQALAHFSGMPKLQGLAVFAEFIDAGADKNSFLSTSHVAKTKVSDALFTIPSTYKKVARQEELFVDKDSTDELNLLNLGH
jgi:hypothetical protein